MTMVNLDTHQTAWRSGFRKRQALWLTVATVAVVLALATVWLLALARPAVNLAAVEETSTELLADLVAAETTADVRAVAEQAQTHSEELAAQLLDEGADDETAEAAQAHLGLWRGIAALGALSGATLDQWDTARTALAGAVRELAGIGDPAAAPGTAALESLDGLVADAVAALQAWETERDVVLAQRERNAASARAVQEYLGTMSAQLDLYEALRPRTTEQVQPLADPDVPNETVWAAQQDLWAGIQDREKILEVASGLVVPPGLQAEHSQILLLLQDAVMAMRSALDGIEEAMQVRYDAWSADPPPPIDIKGTEGWQEFSAVSARINAELPTVRAALQEHADASVAQYEQIVPLPPRPVV